MLAFRWVRYVVVLLMASPVLMPVAAIQRELLSRSARALFLE
jgi:hypothetical protein